MKKKKPVKRSVVKDQKLKAPVKLDAMEVFRAEAKDQRRKVAHATEDGFDNFVARLGVNSNNTLSAGTYEFNLVTRNRIKLEAAYRGSWIVGAVVDSVAEDMTRAGITLTTSEADADIKEFKNTMTKLQIWGSTCQLIKWGRLYGGAIGVMQIKGQDLATPLNLDSIGQDQFKGIVVYDRWQLNPDLTKIIKEGPNMGLPEFYQIVTGSTQSSPTEPTPSGQLKVHHSRCIRYTGIDLPFFQAITEMMWGESILERLWDRLISFDSVTMSSANLVERANNRTVGIAGLREIIAAGGAAQSGLEAMFEMMREFQTNEGLTLLDKEDTFDAKVYTFAGLSDLMLQFGQQLAGASGIPLVRLFGQSPAGLSATGEADIRMYYDNINAQQEAKLRNAFDDLIKVMWRSKFGKAAPTDLEFSFTSLWQMSATDKATNAKTVAETVTGVYQAGITDRKTALEELRDSSADTGLFSSITDEQINEAENDPPPMPDQPVGAVPAAQEEQLPEQAPEKEKKSEEAKPEPKKTGDRKPFFDRLWGNA